MSEDAFNAFWYRTGDQSRDIVLALTTNRPRDLDSAITNPFDERLEFPFPGEEERVTLLSYTWINTLHRGDNRTGLVSSLKRKAKENRDKRFIRRCKGGFSWKECKYL